jgi:hypothetical protein
MAITSRTYGLGQIHWARFGRAVRRSIAAQGLSLRGFANQSSELRPAISTVCEVTQGKRPLSPELYLWFCCELNLNPMDYYNHPKDE